MSKEIDREAVQRMLAEGAQLVEVLPAKEYELEHLPAAVNLPLKELTRQRAAQLQPSRPLIVYCYDSQ